MSKAIIGGLLYDTDTSENVASWIGEPQWYGRLLASYPHIHLYRTKNGRWFQAHSRIGDYDLKVVTEDQAKAFVGKNAPGKYEILFGKPTEA